MRAFGWLDAITGLLISSSLLHSFSKYYIEFNNFIYQDQVKILLLQVFDRIHLQVIIHKFSLFLKDFMPYALLWHRFFCLWIHGALPFGIFLWDKYLYSILLYVIIWSIKHGFQRDIFMFFNLMGFFFLLFKWQYIIN